MPATYRGLSSHRSIVRVWLLHAAWDLPHHIWGNPIWPFMPTSSFGRLVFNTLIVIWFLGRGPTLGAARSWRALRRFTERLLEVEPPQQRVERRAQGLSPVREAVVHLGRDLVMNEAPDDAISFHLAQLLNQHFLRHGRDRAAQL